MFIKDWDFWVKDGSMWDESAMFCDGPHCDRPVKLGCQTMFPFIWDFISQELDIFNFIVYDTRFLPRLIRGIPQQPNKPPQAIDPAWVVKTYHVGQFLQQPRVYVGAKFCPFLSPLLLMSNQYPYVFLLRMFVFFLFSHLEEVPPILTVFIHLLIARHETFPDAELLNQSELFYVVSHMVTKWCTKHQRCGFSSVNEIPQKNS